MSLKTRECQYCDEIVEYEPEANFIVICSNCKRKIYFECEYGYGPVTPCSILLGQKRIAKVVTDHRNQYILYYNDHQIQLKERYLEALNEAVQIISGIINSNKNDCYFEIKKKGGFLYFYGDSFGRPGDNFHEVVTSSYQNNILEIGFNGGEQLIVFEPHNIINTTSELSIQNAKLVKWIWIPYGSSQKKIKKISYQIVNGLVYKKSSYKEEYLERKSPYAAVYMR